MSQNNNLSGGLSGGSPHRHDRVPDTARSLESKGQVESVLAGAPSENVTAGQRGDECIVPGTSSASICKGNIKEVADVNMDIATDVEDDDTDLNTTIIRKKVIAESSAFSESESPGPSMIPTKCKDTPLPMRTPKKRTIAHIIQEDDSPPKQSSDDAEIDTGAVSLSDDSFEEQEKQVKTKSKNIRKSKKGDSPIDDLFGNKNLSAQSIGERAVRWIEEVDVARAKSKNLQGRTSGDMKNNLRNIKTVIEALVDRAADIGDPLYLKQENKKLKCSLNEHKSNVKKLTDQVSKLAKQMEFLIKENANLKMQVKELSKNSNVSSNNISAGNSENNRMLDRPKNLKLSNKPQIISIEKGNFITPEKLSKRRADEVVKDAITIDEEIERLNAIRDRLNNKYLNTPTSGSERSVCEYNYKTNSNRNVETRYKETNYNDNFPAIANNRNNNNRKVAFSDLEDENIPINDEGSAYNYNHRETTVKRQKIRRAPRKTVVSIKADNSSNISYADIIKVAKDKIHLTEYGNSVRLKKALNGSLMVEIPGGGALEQADKLCENLRKVLNGKAIVTRPIAMGEARLSGFDESLSKEEISGIIATAVGGKITDFKVSNIITMRSGMYMTWISGPLIYIDRLANLKKVRLGWSIARVDQSKARRVQCFKCWFFGHTANNCTQVVDRTGCCFRCGETGHLSKICKKKNRCIICDELGLSNNHRIGSFYCTAANNPGTNNVRDGNKNVNYPTYSRIDMDHGYAKQQRNTYHVVFASELPCVPQTPGWYCNDNKLVAVYVDPICIRPAPTIVCNDRNVIAVKLDKLVLASVYISPHCNRTDFESPLSEISEIILRNSGRNVMIVGNFNARSTLWSDVVTNWRGELLQELVVNLDISILNNNIPTCVRPQGSSIIDLTLVTRDLGNSIVGWRVYDYDINLSDHRWASWKFCNQTRLKWLKR
ncbi:uncharacterized protein [Cardiocondyla obscurior]|uniref:uncharacterized protein n=1 Tax=Cardiocondyla obscurior TaxID=286306 RepID=UPI0039657848